MRTELCREDEMLYEDEEEQLVGGVDLKRYFNGLEVHDMEDDSIDNELSSKPSQIISAGVEIFLGRGGREEAFEQDASLVRRPHRKQIHVSPIIDILPWRKRSLRICPPQVPTYTEAELTELYRLAGESSSQEKAKIVLNTQDPNVKTRHKRKADFYIRKY